MEALQNDKSTPLPLHLAMPRTKATAAAEEGTLPSKKHFQLFYPTSVYSFCGKHTHTCPRATPASIPLEQYLAMLFLHWLNGLIHLNGVWNKQYWRGSCCRSFQRQNEYTGRKANKTPTWPPTSAITTREFPDGCIHPKLDFWEMNANSVAIGCLEQQPRHFASV